MPNEKHSLPVQFWSSSSFVPIATSMELPDLDFSQFMDSIEEENLPWISDRQECPLLLKTENPQWLKAKDMLSVFGIVVGTDLSVFEQAIGQKLVENVSNTMDIPPIGAWSGPFIDNILPQKDAGASQAEIIDAMSVCAHAHHLQSIEVALKGSVFLTGELFRFLGTAGSPFAHHRVQNIKQAIQLMGMGQIYKWLATLLAHHSSGPKVLLLRALVHGRFLEMKAKKHGLPMQSRDQLFLVGLFATIGQILGKTPQQIHKDFFIPETVVEILENRPNAHFLPVLESRNPTEDFLLASEALIWSRQIQNKS